MHVAVAFIAGHRNPGIQKVLDCLVTHIVTFHYHTHHHPALMSADQGIPDTRQVEVVGSHIHGKARLVDGPRQDLIRPAFMVGSMQPVRVCEIELDPIG